MSNLEDKKKALSLVLEKMDKTYGKGTVMKLGNSAVNDTIEVIPSDSLELDIALGYKSKSLNSAETISATLGGTPSSSSRQSMPDTAALRRRTWPATTGSANSSR